MYVLHARKRLRRAASEKTSIKQTHTNHLCSSSSSSSNTNNNNASINNNEVVRHYSNKHKNTHTETHSANMYLFELKMCKALSLNRHNM